MVQEALDHVGCISFKINLVYFTVEVTYYSRLKSLRLHKLDDEKISFMYNNYP